MSVSRFNQRISNQPSGGGNKLQGLAPTTNKIVSAIRAINISSWGPPETREKIVCMNQLGGIGTRHGQFSPSADGTSSCTDPYIDYNLSISENFQTGMFEDKLFKAIDQKNVSVSPSGSGVLQGGFKSNTGTNASLHYVHFGGYSDLETSYSPLFEHYDLNYYNVATYKPRCLKSKPVMDIITTNNLHEDKEIISFTIVSITISWIAGDGQNGGD